MSFMCNANISKFSSFLFNFFFSLKDLKKIKRKEQNNVEIEKSDISFLIFINTD